MKKQLLYFTMSLVTLAFIWSCDNGNADVSIIDGPPSISIGAITSGTVEGQDFTIAITLSDGIDGSTISALASLDWAISGGGATVASGTETLSGDNQVFTISVAGGFNVGDYNLDLTATDTNGNSATDNLSFSVAMATPAFDITGDWRIEPVAGAFKVGPTPGSSEWWQSAEGDVATRACQFDDVYTFNQDGSFHIDMGDATWLETWQGVGSDQCGAPVAPFVSSTSFTYTYTSTTLTLIGQGAHVGLPKVNNQGEISQSADAADQIAYNITDQSSDGTNRRMTLQIEAGDDLWWEFLLISGPPAAAAIEGTWVMEPIEGALAVGPTAGSNAWWQNSAADVTARACYFDDTYTFDASGNLTIDMGAETWLEAWQGADGCGAPVAPFAGGTYTYTYSGSDLTVNGSGAFIGLPKVTNTAEITDAANAPASVTYTVSSISATNMTLQINFNPGGEGWWQYKLVKQ